MLLLLQSLQNNKKQPPFGLVSESTSRQQFDTLHCCPAPLLVVPGHGTCNAGSGLCTMGYLGAACCALHPCIAPALLRPALPHPLLLHSPPPMAHHTSTVLHYRPHSCSPPPITGHHSPAAQVLLLQHPLPSKRLQFASRSPGGCPQGLGQTALA